jgi:hypothetical protein
MGLPGVSTVPEANNLWIGLACVSPGAAIVA